MIGFEANIVGKRNAASKDAEEEGTERFERLLVVCCHGNSFFFKTI
jgi:hypothetical protein